MSATEATDTTVAAKLFRGLSDRTRLAILTTLADEGELRVTDLLSRLGGSQSNISGHMSCLRDCQLVIDRPVGRQVFYRVAGEEVVGVLRAAEALLGRSGQHVALCPNYRGGER